jgi:hypothetical protein
LFPRFHVNQWTRTEYVVGLGMETQDSIVMGRCGSRKRGPPGRSNEQAKSPQVRLPEALVPERHLGRRGRVVQGQSSDLAKAGVGV